MNELKMHVDFLFRKYPINKHIKELKEEILGNLESKKADLIAEGLDEDTAVTQAKQSITTIDYLIDGNRRIYINQYMVELLQWVLIYLLVSWIITIPLQIGIEGNTLSFFLFCIAIIVGVIYLTRSKNDLSATKYVNTASFAKWKKYVWIIWGLFFLAATLYTTALNFGSNIWFSRSIYINGPYQFAIVAIKFILPIVTIQIPLIVNKAFKLLNKYEVSDLDEN
ncbi:permease prefix domain 1-containing protein [Heyndrickxia sporothermodurans]